MLSWLTKLAGQAVLPMKSWSQLHRCCLESTEAYCIILYTDCSLGLSFQLRRRLDRPEILSQVANRRRFHREIFHANFGDQTQYTPPPRLACACRSTAFVWSHAIFLFHLNISTLSPGFFHFRFRTAPPPKFLEVSRSWSEICYFAAFASLRMCGDHWCFVLKRLQVD